MRFYKGHKLTPQIQKIVKICKMCDKEFITNNFCQKYCGSTLQKIGCSHKNKMKSCPQYIKDKECIMCNNMFKPSGNNQKYCGGKYIQFTCSWKNQLKKQGILWLKGFTVKI